MSHTKFSNADGRCLSPVTPGSSRSRGVTFVLFLACLGLALVGEIGPGFRGSARANSAVSPLSEVKTTVNQAVTILHDQAMPIEQRRRELRQLAEHNLDLAKMARGSLGDHWDELTPAERNEYVSLFTAFIEDAYLVQIQDYAKLNIDVTRESFTAPDYAQVFATVLQPHEEPLPIVFMLERNGDEWIVYDVSVEDVSMVENYHAQFDRVIRSEGMPKLLNDLRQKKIGLAALVGER